MVLCALGVLRGEFFSFETLSVPQSKGWRPVVRLREDVRAALRAAERPCVTLVRAGALGDTLLLLPALRVLLDAAPQARLTLVAGAWAQRLRPLLPWPVRIVRFDGPAMTPLFAPGARADPSGAFAGASLVVACAARPDEDLVLNVRRLCPGPVIHWPVDPPAGTHAAAHFARAVAAHLPDPDELPQVSLRVPADLDAWAGAWIEERLAGKGEVLAVHPGSGGRRKCWPAGHFAQLVRRLGMPVLLLEGPADAGPCARVAGLVGRALPLVRAAGFSVPQAAALLARCRLYVGNDSGVSHLAAALGAATVAVFGPTDPAAWRPLGPRVLTRGGRPSGWPALEQVEAACRRALASADGLDFPHEEQ